MGDSASFSLTPKTHPFPLTFPKTRAAGKVYAAASSFSHHPPPPSQPSALAKSTDRISEYFSHQHSPKSTDRIFEYFSHQHSPKSTDRICEYTTGAASINNPATVAKSRPLIMFSLWLLEGPNTLVRWAIEAFLSPYLRLQQRGSRTAQLVYLSLWELPETGTRAATESPVWSRYRKGCR